MKGWKGVLWQGRYFSTALDEAHLWSCIRYVEQNPVRAGIVSRAQDYTWSSAAGHCGLRKDPVLVQGGDFSGEIDGWSEVLAEIPDPEIVDRIRRRTHTGVPCGDDKFVKRMSLLIKRELIDRSRGRPRKSQC